MTIKRWHCSSNEKIKLKQQSIVNIQNTGDDLKILLRILFYKNCIIIPQLIHTRDYSFYAWTRVDTVAICTPDACRTLRQSYCSTRRVVFNPYLSSYLVFRHLYCYRLPSTSVHCYRVITIRRIFRRVPRSPRGLLFGLELSSQQWVQIGRRAVEEGQEVES